jgi:predicted TIM-barrel fold metal-dependent hydrolase
VTLPAILDAHHHLWDLTRVDYPWLREKGVRRFFGDPTPIQRDYLPATFQSDHDGLPVIKSVHIQVGAAPGSELDETRWLEEAAGEGQLPSAIVAFCDLSAPDHRSQIEAQLNASKRLRGIRQIVSRHPVEDRKNGSPQLLRDPAFLVGLRTLAELDLSFDLQLTPPYLEEVALLLERVPKLRVALCHAGSPWDQTQEGLRLWKAGLSKLAENENVSCKLSGFGMFDPDWTRLSLQPLVEGVLEIFGPGGRTMWGSNFPVDKLYRDYRTLFETVRDLVPASEHDAVFRGTAETFYRL